MIDKVSRICIFSAIGEASSGKSDDPFDLYPLINKDCYGESAKKKKGREISLSNLNKVNQKKQLLAASSVMSEGNDCDKCVVEGVERRLKRGRRMKSLAEVSGIGKVILDGGTNPKDCEIEACNRLLV